MNADDDTQPTPADEPLQPAVVTLTIGKQYILATNTDGLFVGTFARRSRCGALFFRDVVRLAIDEHDTDRREAVFPADVIAIAEWRHAAVSLLPYVELIDYVPSRASRLAIAPAGPCRKGGTS